MVDQVLKHNKKPGEINSVYGISERRVQQLVQEYKVEKKYPELKKNRRPKTLLTSQQEKAIEIAYLETLLNPRMLYYELKKRKSYAPKNKIYDFMKNKGWVQDEPKKQKKRKRCRYERNSTGSLLHADYHRKTENSPHCIFWLDDASRKILSGAEFDSPSAENAIKTLEIAEQVIEKYGWTVEQINTDRGSAFVANKGEGKSKLQKHCDRKNIKLIPSRVKNPQTNGKVERRWQEYDKHRHRFKTLQEWIDWHNNRLTTALDIEAYETPNEAFIRRLPNLSAVFWEVCEK